MRTVAFCEIEPYARAVLAKHWPNVPCYDDITKREFVRGEADVICGGFPCQDISTAGNGAGLAGQRSGLWRDLLRAIRLVRPKYAVVENVAALLGRGMGTVLGDLASVGYDTEWHCIPASAAGAPHRRDRVWVIANSGSKQHEGNRAPLSGSLAAQLFAAYADSRVHAGELAHRENSFAAERSESGDGSQGQASNGQRLWLEPGSSCEVVANADALRQSQPQGRESDEWRRAGHSGQESDLADTECLRRNQVVQSTLGGKSCEGAADTPEHSSDTGRRWWWATEPNVGRVADGVPFRVDRLKGLGNAVVPQIPEIIGRAILQAEAERIAA
jgi:DNA (cytosine-5)-methyltransferase 1